jgi:hypothetical protein
MFKLQTVTCLLIIIQSIPFPVTVTDDFSFTATDDISFTDFITTVCSSFKLYYMSTNYNPVHSVPSDRDRLLLFH